MLRKVFDEIDRKARLCLQVVKKAVASIDFVGTNAS